MIGILNYGMGNIRSVTNALSFLGVEFFVIGEAKEIPRADKFILPGVGAFGAGMKQLTDLGFVEVLQEEVFNKGKPILGICLGMQLFAEQGFEDGIHRGMGWIPGVVRKMEPPGNHFKIPHMGWNEVRIQKESLLFEGIAPNSTFYFVHSYYLDCPREYVSTICTYGFEFTASVEWRNIFGTQFHPEKSQDAGLLLLRNFAQKEMN